MYAGTDIMYELGDKYMEKHALKIRKAMPEDLQKIADIYENARKYMAESGNPTQWSDSYPTEEILTDDMMEDVLNVIYDESGVHGVFVAKRGKDPTYEVIYGGSWLNEEPYVTIHRIAGDGTVHGIFDCAVEYVKSRANNIRIDTHDDNRTMQKHLLGQGFVKCGTIITRDGTPRLAYQWHRDDDSQVKSVLCYGDSNTYGYDPKSGGRYPGNVRWTGILKNLLGPGYRIIEEGCNGRTTVITDPEEPWKNGESYLRACLNTHKPVDIVILMLGSNDLKKAYNASPKDIAAGAGKLVSIIKEFCGRKQSFIPQIILVSPPHIGEGIESSAFSHSFAYDAVERSKGLAPEYERTAKELGCIFLDAAAVAEASEEDSLHLSAESHRALAAALSRKIAEI